MAELSELSSSIASILRGVTSPPTTLVSFARLSPDSSFIPAAVAFTPSFTGDSTITLPVPLIRPMVVTALFSGFVTVPSLSSSYFRRYYSIVPYNGRVQYRGVYIGLFAWVRFVGRRVV